MNSYSISHAVIGVSYVAVHQDNAKENPTVLRLKSPGEKEHFLLDVLQKGDKLYCENGGASDKVALIGLARGATVFRVPTFKIGTGRIKQGGEIADTPLAKWLDKMDWPLVEESAHGEESSHELTVRRTRAVAISAMSVECLGEFLEVGDPERRLLEVQRLYRAYRASQKVLLATYQRLLANYNDRYLLVMASQSEAGTITGARVSTEAVRQVLDALLLGIPDNEREQFVARLGLEKFFAKTLISRNDVRKLFSKIIEEMMKGEVLSPFLTSMNDTIKEIVHLLSQDKIHEHVFAPLPGCGPLIAARIMAAIVDIRRFESDAALKAYAGYHHFEDGSRARRRKGRASNWNQELKQAVWQWTQQTIKLPKSPWRAKLDLRKAFELYKLLLQRQEMAMDKGLELDIMHPDYWDRQIKSTYDMVPEDLEILTAHVTALREKAGVKKVKKDGEERTEEELAEMEANKAANPDLAKLTRGLLQVAQDKSFRWLGQQLLKHIFKAWRDALKLPELEKKSKTRKVTKKAGTAPPKRTRTKKPAKKPAKKSTKKGATKAANDANKVKAA
jgi:hypothetical protein